MALAQVVVPLDRHQRVVRAREFEPSEYLDPTVASDRLLAPAQQTGATIAIVSCYRGFNCAPGAEGVGRATTRAVVKTAIAVLLFDFMITAVAI